MRSILKNKKGVQFGMNEFLTLLLGLIIILLILYFMFGKEWGTMFRNFLPTMETTANNSYHDISGTDEVFYDLPSNLPSYDINPRITSDCPYYVIKYQEGIFSIFNSSGARIGAFKNRTLPVNSWNIYDLAGVIKIYQQGTLEGSGILNDINYYGTKSDSANNFYFDGQKIVCSVKSVETNKPGTDMASDSVSYYVSKKDCLNTWNFADEYCIIKKIGDKTEEMNFYFDISSFENAKTYSLNLNTPNLFSMDIKNVCSITVGSPISSTCIQNLRKYNPYPDLSGKMMDTDGRFVNLRVS